MPTQAFVASAPASPDDPTHITRLSALIICPLSLLHKYPNIHQICTYLHTQFLQALATAPRSPRRGFAQGPKPAHQLFKPWGRGGQRASIDSPTPSAPQEEFVHQDVSNRRAWALADVGFSSGSLEFQAHTCWPKDAKRCFVVSGMRD